MNRIVQVRRVYDEPLGTDGARILVDRLWPRGLSKERARLDEWLKDVAPSTELREWYGHVPERFDEFSRRYEAELAGSVALQSLKDRPGAVTLLTASKHPEISEAAVLARLLADTH